MYKKILSVLLSLCLMLSMSVSAMADSVSLEDFTDYGDIAGTEWDWCKESLSSFVDAGILTGDGGRILPRALLTRAQFVVLLSRLGVAGGYVTEKDLSWTGATEFTDVEPGRWYVGAIHWATKQNIINGVGNGMFAPQGKLTGEQMVTILQRFVTAYDIDLGISDLFHTPTPDTSAWAIPGVQICLDYELLAGVPQMVDFKDHVNRATAVLFLYNMTQRSAITF